ncbi:MAG: toll/interleukin-1 receptor domain-containing protein [Candidatus Sulfotelmatobacter sp.]
MPSTRKRLAIFLSYRRSDSAGYTGRLSDRLRKEFGEARYFRDIDTIKLGTSFVQSIEDAVSSCSVLVALIGSGWATATDTNGHLRLEDPNDFVRLEIASALNRKIPIIPVLVGGATIPRAESVPADIRGLLEYEAHELSDRRWAYDLDQLVVQIKDIVNPRWRLRRATFVAACVLLVLSGLAVAGRRLATRPPVLKIPRFAAVNPINSTGDKHYDYLSTEIGDSLGAGLASPSKLNVIPPEDVLSVLEDVSISPDQCSKKANPGLLRDLLGASYLIFGDFHPTVGGDSKKFHLRLCLEDAYGKVLDKFDADATAEEMEAIAAQAAAHFRAAIGYAGVSVADAADIYPQNARARSLYFEGLSKLRSLNARDALTSLEQAAALEDSNPLIHAAMADGWSMLRRNEEAKREAKLALDRSTNASGVPLPPEYREAIKARAAEINSKWGDAATLYDSLVDYFPEQIDYGLKLASVRTAGSEPAKALDEIRELKKLPPPLGQDPRISIEESKAYEGMSDHRKASHAAESAVQRAQDKDAHLLIAVGLVQLCWTRRQLGDPKAMTDCDRAQKIFDVFNDEVAAAVAYNDIATGLSDQGRYDEAKEIYSRVISVTKNANDSVDMAGALINKARVSILKGDGDAEPLLRQALDVSHSVDDKYDEVLAQIILAGIDQDSARLADAAKRAADARDLAHSIQDRSSEAYALGALARAQSEAGDLTSALQNYQHSMAIRQDLGEEIEVAITGTRIGQLYLRVGQFADAEKQYKDALQIFGTKQKPSQVTQTKLYLTSLDLEREQFADAEADVKSALDDIAKNDPDTKKDPDTKADALSFLVRSLIGQGRLDDAKARYQDIEQLRFSDFDVGLDVSLADGLLLTQAGDPTKALTVLKEAEQKAREKGESFSALEFQLAVVKAYEKSNNRDAAKNELGKLRGSAQSCSANLGSGQHCGFPLISAQVRKLGRSLRS